jgi:signal transduction histidine kinase
MKGHSLKRFLLISWMVPFVLTIAGSAMLSVAISYLDYSNHGQALESKLRTDAEPIARRIAAELLLKENGRLDSVRAQLINDYQLERLEDLPDSKTGSVLASQFITVNEPLPDVLPTAHIQVVVSRPHFGLFINFKNFLFALVPLLGLVLSGFFIQRRLLRRYIIQPIQTLSDTSIGNKPVKPHWPLEIQRIASDLAESFSNREQAIFGQLARGLIHDIRTQINSINTAMQLAKESKDSSERSARLDRLESACSRNIPKLRELLDLSLDSSREITLKPTRSDLSKTVQQAVLNIQELAEANNVTIDSQALDAVVLNHDSLQFERVLTNLLKNAVEAASEKRSKDGRVAITTESTPVGLTIRIDDNGPGFPAPNHFIRPLKTTKPHGHGLGLFVSKKIVQAHHGSLEAGRSEKLGGACVTIRIRQEEVVV